MVVYTTVSPIRAIWATQTDKKGAVKACMQTDGNFVLYTANNVAVWETRTQNNQGAYLEMQYDGQMAIWRNGKGIFASGVTAPCVRP